MNKKQVINIFGSVSKTARAVGVTRSAVSQWPDDLPQIQVDRAIGAAIRLGISVPDVNFVGGKATNKNASAVANG